jgi:phosphate-selective porin OprO/OprP
MFMRRSTNPGGLSKEEKPMKVKIGMLSLQLLVAGVILFVPLSVHAQAYKEKPQEHLEPKRESNNDLEQLRSKVDQLQSLVEQQQRALTEVLRRLDELKGTPRVAVTTSDPDDKIAVSPDLRPAAPGPNAASESAPPANEGAVQDKPKPVAGWDGNHAFLRSADGSFETFLTGYGQLDFRGYQEGNHPPNTFLIRRARLALEGKVARYFDFKVEGDFADTSSTLLRDFYVNINRIDEFQLRFGQFRVPISQEEIRRDQVQDFVERSMVNNLVPSRSPGLMASGVIDKGVFEYQIGAFNGKGLLANNNNGTPETAIRLRFAPWKNGKEFISKGFIIGGAFTQGRSLGGASVRGQTESRSFSFFVPDAINGKYIRANGEMTWMLGPAAIRAEYDQTNQRRDNLGVAGRNLPGVVAKGYTAQFTYLLTGEEKPETGAVTPKTDLFGDGNGKHGYGAWELKFRYANLQIADGTAKSNRADSFYFGPNWYMNRFIRYVLDLGFERFKDSARSPIPGDRNFFVVLSRVQVAF